VTPVFDGTTSAVLALYDHRRDRFDASDATLMQTVAEQVASTLRAVRLRDESEQRSQRLALTTEVAGAIASARPGAPQHHLRDALAHPRKPTLGDRPSANGQTRRSAPWQQMTVGHPQVPPLW